MIGAPNPDAPAPAVRVFFLNLAPDGTDIVCGWGQAEGEDAAAVALAIDGRIKVDPDMLAKFRAGGTWRWNGTDIVPAEPVVDLDRERVVGRWRADQQAEALRRPILSAGAGQAMEYMLAVTEANNCIRAGSEKPDHYPLLVAEQEALHAMGQTSTLIEVAQQIVRADWAARTQLAAVRKARRIAKMTIAAAQSADEIEAALTVMKGEPHVQ